LTAAWAAWKLSGELAAADAPSSSKKKMLSGLADDEAADAPSADADELAADSGVAVPVLLLLLLLLQPAATRARTLSPAAAITRFMVDIPPLLRGEVPGEPRGPPVTAPC
jgi:hypothetical protein